MASRRQYLTEAELAEYANITITNSTEADDQISQAEEIIDDYVGFQQKFMSDTIRGMNSGTANLTTQFTIQTQFIPSYPYTDFFKSLTVEIISGTNAGIRRTISASTNAGVITCDAFDNAILQNDIYHIFQLGKFPRQQDGYLNNYETPFRFYKAIPEAVRRAVAAQVQYMIKMGDNFFASNSEEISESIGDYSYTKKSTANEREIVAPKARIYLKGIVNRLGTLVYE